MPSDFASHKSAIWQAHLLIITVSFLRRRRNVRMRYLQFDCWVLLLSGGMTENDDTLESIDSRCAGYCQHMETIETKC
jgi:hypothetical protein